MDQKHEMVLEKTYPSGAEEWNCPTCGRRMVINWEPSFKRTVLETGDIYASHAGFKGRLPTQERLISSMSENSSQEATELPIDQARLAPWEAWLDEINFENLWDSDDQ